MAVFSFDVTGSTHELLRRGVTEGRLFGSRQRWHRIVVEAPNRDDAALVAAQMCSLWCMCTGVYDRI